MEVQFLSGGNQQKTVLAKWLLKGSKVLIVDEPTQGVDVNAKTEIYSLLTNLAKEGKAIVIISSDMPELVSLSDRVLVVRNGGVVDELAGKDITEEKILHSAIEVV
jgi:ABC-type sugar transport system ATPase subunit